MKFYTWLKKRYGNEGGEGSGEGGEGTQPPKEKTFTQKELDGIINKRFAKERTEKEALLKQLQTLQETAQLTSEERSGLEQQIQSLTDSLQTKEQQAALAAKKLEDKYNQEREKLSQERDTWKNRFVDSTIRRALTDAAVSSNAQDPSQIVMMFGSATKLEDVLDGSGKPTGDFAVTMSFQGIDPETKKPAQLKLPVAEAIQHMRDNGLHKNLFKHTSTPGTGQGGSGEGKGKSQDTMPNPKDYASGDDFQKAYQSWRNTHNVDGTPIKA